jgi:outer membrane immunogenic protein
MMKHVWRLAAVAMGLIAASTGAFAADLANRTAYPPPPPPPPLPIFSWTGFYIGANLGGAFASGTLTDNVTGASITGNNSGVIGGGTIGYNWQFAPNWVVGIEGMFDGTSIGKTSSTANGTFVGPGGNPFAVSVQGNASTTWVGTVAGRLGFAEYNWLFYAKGGGAWANNNASLTASVTGSSIPSGFATGTLSASNTASGWLAGVGIEYGLTQNWTVKVEYDYIGLANWTATSPFAVGDSINVSRQINLVTLGVNYKF